MKKHKIGLDIGGTKILTGLIDDQNKVIKKTKNPSLATKDNQTIIKNIEKNILDICDNDPKNISQIGIGFAGQINHEKGIVISTTNFGPQFKNIHLQKILENKFKIPVLLENDVKALAKAEIKYGIGQKHKNFISLTFGTGIGGAIVTDGKLFTGKDNLAGEFGYMKIKGHEIKKFTKQKNKDKNSWESLASGKAWYQIKDKYNEKIADKIIAQNISEGLSNINSILNPEIIVVGGGLIEQPGLLAKIQKNFKNDNFHTLLNKTKIVKTKLKDNAILLGSLIK